MKQDLLRQWLDVTDLEYPPLERPLKRRRIDYPSERGTTSKPLYPLVPQESRSDDHWQASGSAINVPWKQIHEGDVDSCGRLVDPINPRLRRTKSDSYLLGFNGGKTSALVQDHIPQNHERSRPGSIASIGGSVEPPPSALTADTSCKNSTGSKQTRIDATNTNYRSDFLASNKVTFKSALTPLPENIAAAVNKFVFERGSSEIDDTTAIGIRDKLIQLGEDAEAELSNGFMTMDILPPKAVEKILKRVQQMPFTNAILPKAVIPQGLSVTIQTICEPKPDVAYGYTLQGFTPSQQITQRSRINGANISKLSRLAKDLYWPFLIIEFKAPAVGGNIYAAENQCAGGGSASLLACQTLYSIAPQANDSTNPTDSIVYSAAIDGAAANLQVHWYDAEDENYCLQRIHHYDLNRSEDIQKFQLHTKNIVDWGVNSRLNCIRATLDVILAEQMKKNKLQIKRPAAEPLSPPIS